MRNLQAQRTRFTSSVLVLTLALIGLATTGGCAADRQTRASLSAGYAALEQRQYDQAIATADQQIQQSPNGPGAAEAFYLKGRALESRPAQTQAVAAANMTAARDVYYQGLTAAVAAKNAALEARLHSGVANTSYWLEDFATAQSEWNKAYAGLDDPQAKSYALYRIGICQQRQGRFDQADQSFAMVQQQFPTSEAAAKAKQHQGAKGFTVQLATFASPNNAEAAAANLRREGATPTRAVDAQGHSIVSVGPFPNYSQAQAARSRFASAYPDAMILP